MGPMIGLLWGILSKNVAHYHDMNHECKNRCVTKSAHFSHFQITLMCPFKNTWIWCKCDHFDPILCVCSGCGSAQESGCQCAVWQVISQGGAICVTMSAICHVAMLLWPTVTLMSALLIKAAIGEITAATSLILKITYSKLNRQTA